MPRRVGLAVAVLSLVLAGCVAPVELLQGTSGSREPSAKEAFITAQASAEAWQTGAVLAAAYGVEAIGEELPDRVPGDGKAPLWVFVFLAPDAPKEGDGEMLRVVLVDGKVEVRASRSPVDFCERSAHLRPVKGWTADSPATRADAPTGGALYALVTRVDAGPIWVTFLDDLREVTDAVTGKALDGEAFDYPTQGQFMAGLFLPGAEGGRSRGILTAWERAVEVPFELLREGHQELYAQVRVQLPAGASGPVVGTGIQAALVDPLGQRVVGAPHPLEAVVARIAPTLAGLHALEVELEPLMGVAPFEACWRAIEGSFASTPQGAASLRTEAWSVLAPLGSPVAPGMP